MRYDGVSFLGAIPREQLLMEQAEAQLLLYPSYYDTAELFCISVAEAQAMGVYPVTSSWGALGTTNMGTVIPGKAVDSSFHKAFSTTVENLCAEPSLLHDKMHLVKNLALNRFHPEIVSEKWREKILT